jgi:ketosteroid isomerase-like protein
MVGLTTVALMACAPAAPDTAADVAAVKQVTSLEAQYVNAADIDGYLSIFSADTKTLPPNEPMMTGTDAIRGWIEGLYQQFTANLVYSESEVVVSGDLAVERFEGTLTLTPKGSGDPMVEDLKGVHVFQRQADGSWKITMDVWNSSAPVGM